MDTISDDDLLKIFSFLDFNDRLRLELVSKRWERLLRQSWRYVRHLEISNCLPLPRGYVWRFNSTEHYRAVFIRCAPFVRSIDFQDWKENDFFISGEVMSIFGRTAFLHLKTLDLSNVYLPFVHLPEVGQLVLLENLNISNCADRWFFDSYLTVAQMELYVGETLRHLTHLKRLTIGEMVNFDGGGCLAHAAMTLENIQLVSSENGSIDASNLFRFGLRHNLRIFTSEYSFDYTDAQNLGFLLQGAPNLAVLEVSYDNPELDVHCFQLLAQFSNLVELRFSALGNPVWERTCIWQTFFLHLMHNSASGNSLELLDISGFHVFTLTVQQLRNFSGCCKNLKKLIMRNSHGFDSQKLEGLLKSCQKLECVSFLDSSLDDACLAAIGRGCPLVKSVDVNLHFREGSAIHFSHLGIQAMVDSIFGSHLRQFGKKLHVRAFAHFGDIEPRQIQVLCAKYEGVLQVEFY